MLKNDSYSSLRYQKVSIDAYSNHTSLFPSAAAIQQSTTSNPISASQHEQEGGGGQGGQVVNECIDVNAYLLENQNDLTEYATVRAGFGLLYSLIFLLGVTGNVSMLYSIFWGRHSHRLRPTTWTVANIILANLGASDILLCLTAVPLSPPQIMLKTWHFGWLMCKISPFSQGTSVLISSLSLCSIAGDRYWSIVDTSRKRVSRKWALFTVLLLWLAAFSVNLPLFLSLNLAELKGEGYRFCGLYCEESEWAHPYLRRTYGTVVLLVQFLFPVLFLAYCYLQILIKVVDRDGMLTNDQQSRAAKRKRRVTYILIAMVAAFVLSWAPLTLINIFVDYGIPLGGFYERQVYLVHLIAHWIAMTSIVWNPILYFWMSQSTKKSTSSGTTFATSNWYTNGGGRGGGGTPTFRAPQPVFSSKSTNFPKNGNENELNNTNNEGLVGKSGVRNRIYIKWKHMLKHNNADDHANAVIGVNHNNSNSPAAAVRIRFMCDFQRLPPIITSDSTRTTMETSCTGVDSQNSFKMRQSGARTLSMETELKRERSEPTLHLMTPSSSSSPVTSSNHQTSEMGRNGQNITAYKRTRVHQLRCTPHHKLSYQESSSNTCRQLLKIREMHSKKEEKPIREKR